MGFRFRQFEVEDTLSTMRVGTDSMLLGAWSQPPPNSRILDIGTGCGVLALMLAQKSTGTIDAVEIDRQSALEAGKNFQQSPWAARLGIVHESVLMFALHTNTLYDFIVSNPPFFNKSLKSPELRKNQARHDTTLTHEELASTVSRLLTVTGLFSTILPESTATFFIRTAETYHLYLNRYTRIIPRPDLPVKRVIIEFSRNKIDIPSISSLTILKPEGTFSDEYLELTAGYHHF